MREGGMTMDDATMLALLNSETERHRSFEERNFEANTGPRFPKAKFAPRDVPMPTRFLHCSLFNAAGPQTPRLERVVDFFPVSSGGFLYYEGSELRQEDETVLLYLLGLAEGKVAECPVTVNPRAACVEMGWSKTKKDASPERLQASLNRMVGVTVQYFDKENTLRWKTGLVWQVKYESKASWEVRLPVDMLSAFEKVIFVNRKVRAELPTGFPSWLFGYICANDCKIPFSFSKLKSLSGSSLSNPYEFARIIRRTMEKIAELTECEWRVKSQTLFVFKKIKGSEEAADAPSSEQNLNAKKPTKNTEE